MFFADASETTPGYKHESPQKDMRILGLSTGDMGAVLILSPGRGTTALMGNLAEAGRRSRISPHRRLRISRKVVVEFIKETGATSVRRE